jgi:hypothetical protein
VLMPATNTVTMLIVDLPLCTATTGSLAAFYMLAESAQGRPRLGALKRLPMIIALGTGLAPHLSKAVFEGWQHMAGEFVRTPKHGVNKGRYRAVADLPLLETGLSALSVVSVIASVQTGHYFATHFALLFTVGYAYVAVLLVTEQAARRRDAVPARSPVVTTDPALALASAEAGTISEPPPASGEQFDMAEARSASDLAA